MDLTKDRMKNKFCAFFGLFFGVEDFSFKCNWYEYNLHYIIT